MNWPVEPQFLVPEDVMEYFKSCVEENKKSYQKWQDEFAKWSKSNTTLAAEWKKMHSHSLPDDLEQQLVGVIGDDANDTMFGAFNAILRQPDKFDIIVGKGLNVSFIADSIFVSPHQIFNKLAFVGGTDGVGRVAQHHQNG